MSETPPGQVLGEKNLKLTDVVAQSVGFMGPVFSVAFLMPLIVGAGFAGKGAGVATPIAVIVAAIGTAAIAWMISRYARRFAACGALYHYVTVAAGRRTGFVAGWAYYGAALLGFSVATIVIVSGTLADFLSARAHVHIGWWVLAIAMTVLVWAMVSLGVRVATRAQLVLVGVSALVVLAFSMWVIIKGGTHGNSFTPFNPGKASFQGIFFGVLYGVALFIGFESAANLAEETAEPKRAIPRALFLSLGLGTLYFVICAYAQAIGFGLNAHAWATSGAPLFVLGANSRFGSQTFSDILLVIVLIDGLSVAIGAWVATTRGIFTLARDRLLPPVLAKTHPRYGTPTAATTLLAVVTIGVVLLMHFTDGLLSRATGTPGVLQPQYYPLWAWLASFGPFLFVFVYLVMSVVGVVNLWREEPRGRLLVAGVIGAALAAATMFGAIYKAPSPLNSAPLIAAGWIALGIGVAVILTRRGQLSTSHEPLLGSHADPSSAGAVWVGDKVDV